MSRFKIGDRVTCISEVNFTTVLNQSGIITQLMETNSYRVMFDNDVYGDRLQDIEDGDYMDDEFYRKYSIKEKRLILESDMTITQIRDSGFNLGDVYLCTFGSVFSGFTTGDLVKVTIGSTGLIGLQYNNEIIATGFSSKFKLMPAKTQNKTLDVDTTHTKSTHTNIQIPIPNGTSKLIGTYTDESGHNWDVTMDKNNKALQS